MKENNNVLPFPQRNNSKPALSPELAELRSLELESVQTSYDAEREKRISELQQIIKDQGKG